MRHSHIIEYYMAMEMNGFIVTTNINESHKHYVMGKKSYTNK